MKILKNSNNRIFSSLSFKFLLALLIVAVVPVGVSFFVFEQISEFNQKLQKAAVDSIEGVSEIYKSCMKNESERIVLIQNNVMLELSRAWQARKASGIRDLLHNDGFRSDVQAIFDRALEENHNFFDIRLTLNRMPIVKATAEKIDRDSFNFHASAMPATFMDGSLQSVPGNVSDKISPDEDQADAMMLVVAQPVDETAPSDVAAGSAPILNDIRATGGDDQSGSYLPSQEEINMRDRPAASHAINKTQKPEIELVILLGSAKSQTELYNRLGEKRYLHGSMSKLEADKEMNITDIYKNLFVYVAAFVFLLCMALAIGISLPMTRRLSELARVTQDVANGDLNAKATVKGNDQLTRLMSQFNDMIDEVRKAQESKAYIERMQAWQEVARRLAHEIKNPLTPIVLSVQQLDRKFDDYIDNPQKYRKLLDDVVDIVNDETKTLHKLVKNFSEFARMPIPETKPAKIAEFVQQVVSQNPQFAESATIDIAAPGAWIMQCEADIDSELMRRVFVNIIRNGIEAAQNAGITPKIDINFDIISNNDKQFIAVIISDNGPGLTEEQKSKLFMPYFTTKADGTGLGLAIVRKIVEEHRGSITLGDRRDGKKGAQATIALPIL